MTNEELCALARSGDAAAAEQLISQNMRFIHQTAAEILHREHELNRCLGLEAEDLAQEGALGLYRCVEKFDPAREVKFLSYAARAIRNAMYDYIGQQDLMLLSEDDDAAPATGFSPQNAEFLEDFQAVFPKLTAREQAYLSYRLGLDQEFQKRSLRETAYHFHLTESWARTTEKHALRDLRELLP